MHRLSMITIMSVILSLSLIDPQIGETHATIISTNLPGIKQEELELVKLGYLPFKITEDNNLVWKYPLPQSLTALWNYGNDNVVLQGAIMQFQHNMGITVDGIFGKQTWSKMQYALKNNIQNEDGYTYALVSEKAPETLTLYFNGKIILRTLVNTGVKGAETPIGTFPVYVRYMSQTMQGTDVNGLHYSDPGVPYVSYFVNGCAIHGFPREHYGSPQSLGCVELPIPEAKIAWEYMDYGTLVTVSDPLRWEKTD